MSTPPPSHEGSSQRPSAWATTNLREADMLTAAGGSAATAGALVPDFPGYEHVVVLSHGGQGTVYRAVQHGTKREVAIKTPHNCDDVARRRFEREIELAGQLEHPNIVPIFHSGVTLFDQPYYVMDFVRGKPLTAFLRDQRLTLRATLSLFLGVCDAVASAHQRGVIHRDLKPSNILVDETGRPRVLDFGLARPLVGHDLTLADAVMGTLPYMAPEQTRGKREEIDTRTDIYALGVVLYEMLTGQLPYRVQGALAEVFREINEAEPKSPERNWSPDSGVLASTTRLLSRGNPIDRDVATIVLKALAKEPLRRYASVGEMAADIRRYLAGDAIDARRDHALYVFRKFVRRNAVALTVLAVIAAIGLIAFDQWRQEHIRAKVADARRAGSERRYAETSSESVEATSGAIEGMRRTAFEAFLRVWRAGYHDAARVVIAGMERSEIGVAARFLLEPEMSEEELRSSVRGADEPLAELVLAERERRDGATESASARLRRLLDRGQRHWAVNLARQVLAAP